MLHKLYGNLSPNALPRRIYRVLRKNILHRFIPESRQPLYAGGKRGIEVIGLFHSSSGIGESARLCARQLAHEGFKVRCRSVEDFLLKPREQAWEFADTAGVDDIGCRIIHLNPPLLPPVVMRLGLRRYAQVFNIGYWAWELERIPAEWIGALRYVNAVFTPSHFASRAVALETAKPVLTVPHPVAAPAAAAGARAHLGIAPGAFLVSNVFSFGSAVERKNPYALIRAFIKAFGDDPGAQLVLKSSHGGDSDGKRKLLETIAPCANIRLVDEVWGPVDVAGLIKESNLYASLHRSEGFGLTIAEAMRLGTPAMASDWSGNTDFCTPENSFPVPVKPIALESSYPEFTASRGLSWADADSDAAAVVLTALRADPQMARAKAEKCLRETNAFFDLPHYARALAALDKSSG